MPENQTYLVRGDDGEEYGPVDLPGMREWVTENRVGLGSSVKLDEPGELWHPWQYFPELVALLAEANVVGMPVLAPWGRRIAAGVLDLVLCWLLMIPPFFVSVVLLPPEVITAASHYEEQVLLGITPDNVPMFPAWFALVCYAIAFGIPALYFTGFLAAHGRTPAKSFMQLQVVDRQGHKPLLAKALLRALVFVMSLFVYGIPLLYVFVHPQRRALHDIVAGTYVVEM